ncbi:MAG: DNA-binding domain-containing protein [Verrucomicrobiota bacterium]
MKNSLAQIQKKFLKCLRVPLNAEDRMQLDSTRAKWVKSEMMPNDRLRSEERIEIYARQYWFRILESLNDDFPGLRALMGDRDFEILIREYIDKFPSVSYTLRDFGTRLPEYLKGLKKRYGAKTGLYHQMATMELAQLHVFDEKDEVPLTTKALGTQPLLRRLQVAPHVRLMVLDYPLDLLQVGLNQEGVRDQLSNGVLDRRLRTKCTKLVGRLPKEKVYLAVHRHERKVYFKRMEQWAYELLISLNEGIPLGKSIEKVLSQKKYFNQGIEARVGCQFQEWSALGWIQVRKSK